MIANVILYLLLRHIAPLTLLVLVSGFNAIVFIQSGIDKLVDYKGNLEWMTEQFKNCFLRNSIAASIRMITLFELLSGFGNIAGVVCLLCCKNAWILLGAYALAGLTLLMLLFGQRVSKNYAGAVSLTGYFLINLIGLLLIVAVTL